MTLLIPTTPVAFQVFDVLLAGQNCQIALYQKATGMFVDLYVNNALVIGGVSALNRNRIVRDAYLGFIGDLFFFDSQGMDDPQYLGLGSRYFMFYLEATDGALLIPEGPQPSA